MDIRQRARGDSMERDDLLLLRRQVLFKNGRCGCHSRRSEVWPGNKAASFPTASAALLRHPPARRISVRYLVASMLRFLAAQINPACRQPGPSPSNILLGDRIEFEEHFIAPAGLGAVTAIVFQRLWDHPQPDGTGPMRCLPRRDFWRFRVILTIF